MSSGGPMLMPAGMDVEWVCETCHRHCLASASFKKGCGHFPIYGGAWKQRARLEMDRRHPPAAAVGAAAVAGDANAPAVPAQGGLAL